MSNTATCGRSCRARRNLSEPVEFVRAQIVGEGANFVDGLKRGLRNGFELFGITGRRGGIGIVAAEHGAIGDEQQALPEAIMPSMATGGGTVFSGRWAGFTTDAPVTVANQRRPSLPFQELGCTRGHIAIHSTATWAGPIRGGGAWFDASSCQFPYWAWMKAWAGRLSYPKRLLRPALIGQLESK